MEKLWQDLRFGFRMLFKSPAFTAVAVLSLALGIGANSAVFSLVNAVLYKPLPVKDPDQLIALYHTERHGKVPLPFSYPDYVDYRDQNDVFAALVGHYGIPLSLSGPEKQAELVWSELVTGNYFSGLGVEPVLGRGFLPEEDKTPGARAVAVLSYDFWQRRFNRDPNIVGKSIKLNGHEFTIVGVAPDGFTGTKFLGFLPEVFVPIMMHAQVWPDGGPVLEGRTNRWLNLRGRLKPGVTIAQSQAALNTIARQLEQAYPEINQKLTVSVIPGSTKTEPFVAVMGYLPMVAGLLLGIVCLVLLIACANVANLLLARASVRRREIAVRLALGASRWRLIRQLLTESIMLALLGGGLGLLLGLWFTDLMRTFAPALDFPTIDFDYSLSLDYRVLSFTLAVSILTGLIFGLLPAWQSSKADLVPTLKSDALTAGRASGLFSLRNVLVVAQVALSLILLVSAGLFVRSLQQAQQMNPGFETKNILLASVDLTLQGYDAAKGRKFHREAVDRVASLPGVESVSLAFPLPLDAYSYGARVLPEGYVPRTNEDRIRVGYSQVGSNYFATMKTPLLQGREFTEHDNADTPPVVVINEAMAQRFWPGQNTLGKRLQMGNRSLEVVGVAQTGKYVTLGEEPMLYMYLPLLQNYDGRVTLLVRTTGEPQGLMGGVRSELQALDAELPVFAIKTMPQFMERSLAGPESIASLVGAFGLLALLLASIGLYGVMNYAVTQRRHEIGIRLALGAQPNDVLRLVVGQGLKLAAIGIALGLLGALALTQLMASLLYGVSATEPTIYGLIGLLLASVSLLAASLPARKAMRVDPMIALRYE